jgi:SAM-dependent methyltransferase
VKRCLSCDTTHGSGRHTCPRCGAEPARVDGYLAHAPELAREGGGYDADLFAIMASVEEQNFWFRSRSELITWVVRQSDPSPGSILEIGCGTGFVLSALGRRFPDAALYGSEIFVDGLEVAAARLPDAELMQMDARFIPFRDEFDVIGAFDVLEHIEEDAAVLDQIREAVRPGGILVASVPQHRWMWTPADDYAHHVRRYTARELRAKVEAAGFEVLRETSFVSLLLPMMAVSRMLSRRSKAEYDPGKEMRLFGPLNWVLGSVMAAERMLIRTGMRFPAGGSRLIVARRPVARVSWPGNSASGRAFGVTARCRHRRKNEPASPTA